MYFLKPVNYFLLLLMILFLSNGLAHAKHKGKAKQHIKYHSMDVNHNGVVTFKEWRGTGRSFHNHDLNGDGIISGNELWAGVSRPDEDDEFSRLDHNRDGIIAYQEWHKTRLSFNQLDDNRDGELNPDEFYNRKRYPDSVFHELDQNNDGRISFGEWHGDVATFSRLDNNADNRLSKYEFYSRQSSNLVEQIFWGFFR